MVSECYCLRSRLIMTLQSSFFWLWAFSQLVVNVTSICPNRCSGHGSCGTDSLCACFTGWTMLPDCSARSCPYGTAWSDSVTDMDEAHAIAECSNMGICDRGLGTCKCFSGFTGGACQRTICPNDCSKHGRCETLKEITMFDGPLYDTSRGLDGGSTTGVGLTYDRWDSSSMVMCNCDQCCCCCG